MPATAAAEGGIVVTMVGAAALTVTVFTAAEAEAEAEASDAVTAAVSGVFASMMV